MLEIAFRPSGTGLRPYSMELLKCYRISKKSDVFHDPHGRS